MLNLQDQHAWEAWTGPLLVLVVRFLLLNTVVAGEVKAFRVIRLKIGIGRRGAKVVKARRKVAVKDHKRIVGVRVFVKALGSRTIAERNIGRPQNLVNRALWIFRCLTYFVSGSLGIGG